MTTRPNILIFMTDQEQADVVQEGHPCQMPHTRRLAREGISFGQAYCPSPHCCPSRATFFTGLYPSRHGVFNNVSNRTTIHAGLNGGVRTWSENLRDAGYQMAFSGKWHVSYEEDPSDRGWHEIFYRGKKNHRKPPPGEQWQKETARYAAALGEPPRARRRGEIVRPGWGNLQLYGSYPTNGPMGYEDHADYKVARAAVDALPDLARNADSGTPWCLYVGVLGPHDPYVVPERFAQRYNASEITLPLSYTDTLDDKPRVYRRVRRQYWDQLSQDEVRESIAHYWAYCTMMDSLLGEVLEALEATGQADNTLVVRLSDHGDYLGAHGLYMKGVPAFREAYHIPCIARWPGGSAQPDRKVSEFVTLADWAPTFLEMAGAEPLPDVSGKSLAPFFQNDGPPDDWPDAVYTQLNGVELYYTQRSVATKTHKYVYNGFDDDELYDLAADPHEMVNVSDQPEYAAVKRELVRKMWRFALRENDIIFNDYGTVALAPFGPADALAPETGTPT